MSDDHGSVRGLRPLSTTSPLQLRIQRRGTGASPPPCASEKSGAAGDHAPIDRVAVAPAPPAPPRAQVRNRAAPRDARPRYAMIEARIDGAAGVALRLDDTPAIAREVRAVMRACSARLEFGEIDGRAERAVVAAAARTLPRGARIHLDTFQVHSIYVNMMRQYSIDNHSRLGRELDAARAEYDAGRSMTEIGLARRLSPYTLFKCMIEARDDDPGARTLFAHLSTGTVAPSDVFDSERDAAEYEQVRKFDFESAAAQRRIAEGADAREHAFITQILRDRAQIHLSTQAELTETALRTGIRAVTPDALFVSPVIINGARAHWVDFKSYFGAPIPFLMRSLEKQARKYTEAFGPGVIAFEHGYTAGLCGRAIHAISLRALRDEIESMAARKLESTAPPRVVPRVVTRGAGARARADTDSE